MKPALHGSAWLKKFSMTPPNDFLDPALGVPVERKVEQYLVRKVRRRLPRRFHPLFAVAAVYRVPVRNHEDYQLLPGDPMLRHEAVTVANGLNALNNLPLCK